MPPHHVVSSSAWVQVDQVDEVSRLVTDSTLILYRLTPKNSKRVKSAVSNRGTYYVPRLETADLPLLEFLGVNEGLHNETYTGFIFYKKTVTFGS